MGIIKIGQKKEKTYNSDSLFQPTAPSKVAVAVKEDLTDEAEELSKRLSADQSKKTDEGDGEENQPQEGTVGAAPAELIEAGDGEEKAQKAKTPRETTKAKK